MDKPINPAELLGRTGRAIGLAQDLTARQREVLDLVLAGQPSKAIAGKLRISPRTVEVHRAAIMRKTGAASVAALARLAIEAEGAVPDSVAIRP